MASPLIANEAAHSVARDAAWWRAAVARRVSRASADAKLILVSAPAGFGKTTLITEWLATVADGGAAVAWLSLDERDNDPAVLWSYVLAALESAVPGLGTNARALLDSADTPPDAVLATLVNELHGVDRDVVLVLDDFHVIDNPDLHDGLAFLLDHLSARARSGADEPRRSVGSAGAAASAGQLVEIRAADLRFTAGGSR